jgi:hypothetical protein
MSRRQHERASRFQVEIEQGVRAAAIAFRDNDAEASIDTVIRLWWTSGLRGRRFVQLLHQAREVTQERVSLGAVERGQPGRREAMPYLMAVLRQLADTERQERGHGAETRRAPARRAPARRAPPTLSRIINNR